MLQGTASLPVHPRYSKLLRGHSLQELLGSDRWYGSMPKECMVIWIIVLHDDREETIVTRSGYKQKIKKRKKKENKRERKERQKQKRKEKNAELRRDTACAQAMAIADRQAMEVEYYIEVYEGYYEDKYEYDDEQTASMYDQEQCAYYYQDYIEERNRDIRKQLHKISQPRMTFICR
jgi:hypothetical protein